MRWPLKPVPFALAAAAALGLSLASADGGEAGLVVQHGDGTTETFCVAFDGNSIRGDELLRRAGVTVEQFGGLVCSLGTRPDEACPAASSFESCTCKCKGAECIYWAFFTRSYGKEWVYSALGFAAQAAKNGDLQAWKWGKGTPMSAPAPANITFEQVCGHPPAAASSPAPTSHPSSPAAPSPENSPPAGAVATSEPSAAVTSGPSPTHTATAGLSTPPPGSSPSPVRPLPAGPGDASSGGQPTGVAVFAAVVAGLAIAIAGAWRWRSHGR
ncbi:MAG: hypothetical protein HUU14_11960 [Dehalococcoidia bacterium]|nr:hypothetical protein [Chloroflexi bacterium CFX7]MCK6564785.1 hypothetical protein [Dehalococcoidia bacterium]NUQ56594.1 hypothetical protein [Dehalococcoidia bacterium]